MRKLTITKQITVRENTSLNKYLKEINSEKLITAEEEANLARKIRQGDEMAIDKLTKANLRFVVSVAKQYQYRGLPLTDLINEGNIGLIKAAKRFDETRGFKLISYAVWFIRQSIQQAIDEQSHMMRLPSNKIELNKKIKKVFIKMEQLLEREPSYEEIGNELCLTAQVINDALNTSRRQVSLDTPLAGTDDLTLMDLIEDKNGENADREQVNKSLAKELENIIATLPSREAEVLSLHYGLNGKKPLTYQEIGDQFGFTKVWAREINDKAILRLKQTSRRKLLKEYLG